MDFAIFMERYGYKIMLLIFIGGALLIIPLLLGYELHIFGYSWNEAGFFIGLLITASIIAAFAGRFMNTMLQLASRLSFINRSKFLEDEKKLKKEQERYREEGRKLY